MILQLRIHWFIYLTSENYLADVTPVVRVVGRHTRPCNSKLSSHAHVNNWNGCSCVFFFVSAAVLSTGRLCSGLQGAPARPPPYTPPPPNVKRFVFFIVALKLYRFCFIYALYTFPCKINVRKPMFCFCRGLMVIAGCSLYSCNYYSRPYHLLGIQINMKTLINLSCNKNSVINM